MFWNVTDFFDFNKFIQNLLKPESIAWQTLTYSECVKYNDLFKNMLKEITQNVFFLNW